MEHGYIKLYKGLIASIENYESRLYNGYGNYINCSKGCSSCCILESVFPLEAWNIYVNISGKPEILKSLNNTAGECVFLKDNACIIYEFRPVICRSHGFPIFIDGRVDFCPKNFKDLESLDSGYILNLEAMNQGIASANMLFIKENCIGFFDKERVNLRELCSYVIEEEKDKGRL